MRGKGPRYAIWVEGIEEWGETLSGPAARQIARVLIEMADEIDAQRGRVHAVSLKGAYVVSLEDRTVEIAKSKETECAETSPGGHGWTCSRRKGHEGDHVAMSFVEGTGRPEFMLESWKGGPA
jgi:hypothetical protein